MTDKEREAFEAWYGSKPERDRYDNYFLPLPQSRWEAWQARAALASDLQAENLEQARLLGMSAERELALLAKIERLERGQPVREMTVEAAVSEVLASGIDTITGWQVKSVVRALVKLGAIKVVGEK